MTWNIIFFELALVSIILPVGISLLIVLISMKSVIYYRSGGFKSLKRITEDYFGAWRILKPWLRKSIEAGNTPPEL